jgi:hypothetical protein
MTPAADTDLPLDECSAARELESVGPISNRLTPPAAYGLRSHDPKGCYRAVMWGKVACRFGVHDWSEWKPVDPDDPSKQMRTCARCSRVKFNNGPVVFTWDYPVQ